MGIAEKQEALEIGHWESINLVSCEIVACFCFHHTCVTLEQVHHAH